MPTRRTSVLVLSALATTLVAHAQTGVTTGGVRGVVKTKAGGPVVGASLVVKNLETGLLRTARTNAQGEYGIPLLPVGHYELTVQAPGLVVAKDARLQVPLGQNAVRNFTLDRAEASAEVEVVDSTTSLDTTQVSTITAVNDKLVEGLPINGRNFVNLALLTPNAVEASDDRVSVDGARGIQNNLTIDGASYNSNFFWEQRGSTRIPFAFSADSIKELQVINNAYSARYNAAGAVINAVSKTGTNRFSGNLMFLSRPESLVAKIRPVPYDPRGTSNTPTALEKKFSQHNLAVSVGGPILKDKLHFFFNAETYRYTEDYVSLFPTSALAGNGEADLNNFLTSFGNTLVVGDDGRTFAQENNRPYSNVRKNTTYLARLDWTINENHRATFRVNVQDWESENGTTTGTNAITTGATNNGLEVNRSISWVGEVNSILSSNLINEARIQFSTERRPRYPNAQQGSEIRVSGFGAGQNEFLPNGLDEVNLQIIDNLTWTSGDWTVSGGFDLQNLSYRNHFFRRKHGQWSFSTYNGAYQWAQGGAGAYTGSGFGTIEYQQGVSDVDGRISFDSKLWGFYGDAQYAGLLGGRLTLNLGLRYTMEKWSDNPRPNAALAGLDKAADNSSVDPRLGFTLDVFGDKRTVIRGGYGWFTSPNPALTVSNTMLGNGNGVKNYRIFVNSSSNATFQNYFKTGILSASQRLQSNRLVMVDPGVLASTFSAGTVIAQVWDPDNKMAQRRQMSIGVDQDLSQVLSGLVVGARVSYAKLLNLQYFLDINLRQRYADGSANPDAYYNDGYPTQVNRFSTSGRPNFAYVRGRRLDLSAFGATNLSLNNGEGTYRSLVLEAKRLSENGIGFTGSLAWSKAEDNNSNERSTSGSTSNTANPADPLALVAPTDNDRRFRAVLGLYTPAYFKSLRGSMFFSWTSGRPYSGRDTADLNGDGLTGNDLSVSGAGRNGYRQPHAKKLDLRLTYEVPVGAGRSLDLSLDVFNALNWANQSTSLTALTNNGTPIADFGFINTPDRNSREVQVSVRFKF